MTRSYSWLIDPTTRDYQLTKGSPIKDQSLQFPAYARLRIGRGTWLYAPDADYGNDLHLITRQSKASGALIENVMSRALQPLIDDGRATAVDIEPAGNARYGEAVTCTITDAEERNLSLTLDPVGL
jgi:phage gp46-like protein